MKIVSKLENPSINSNGLSRSKESRRNFENEFIRDGRD